jgi:phosphate transport system permease protein
VSATDNTAQPPPRPALVISDRAFSVVLGIGGLAVFALIVIVGLSLAKGARPAIDTYGWRFAIGRTWDPVHKVFGALPYIYGTLASTILALAIAVPVGLAIAIFLAEIAPRGLGQPVGFLVELLAAVPSVVLGMWGIFVLVPLVRKLEGVVQPHVGSFFLFRGPPTGLGLLTSGIILAIMILPFITAISRDAILAVPKPQGEAALALGATPWEMIRGPVLRYARKGILGGVILATGRALGETMAVTIVIGNCPTISLSLFESSYTMSALIANEFAEATELLHRASLINVALLLLGVTLVVNALARLLIWTTVRHTTDGTT